MQVSMTQAAQAIEQSFTWISEKQARGILDAYLWAVHAKHETWVSEVDVAQIKAIIITWLSESHDEARLAVTQELNEIT